MRVELGKFARDALRATVDTDLPDAVRAAIMRYAEILQEGKTLAPPAFRATEPPVEEGAFDLPLAAEVEAALEAEAHRYKVSPQQIILQAVLSYVAEVDRGAVGTDASAPPSSAGFI